MVPVVIRSLCHRPPLTDVIFRQSLHDALSRLDEAKENFARADLHILPPCSTLSDEDSDDEDEPESLNHRS